MHVTGLNICSTETKDTANLISAVIFQLKISSNENVLRDI